jgi:hypothetical protein
MEKVKVQLMILGGLKYDIDFNELKKWKTSFFEINENIMSNKSLPNSVTEKEER